MHELFRFRDFTVYKNAKIFRRDLRLIAKRFPKQEQFILTQQLLRALDSITLNIAEGSAKQSEIDFKRFLNISLGSVFETVACLDLALDEGYLTKEEHQKYLNKAEVIAKQIRSFAGKLGKNHSRI